MPYAVAELREDQEGGFSPRGAALELWRSRDFETLISGPAETGKTWSCLQYVDALLWKYPGAQAVMARKTYSSLVGSAVRTFLRIKHESVKPFGGEKPEWFQYPNGSRLWVAGLDNPGKALSSERDLIYVNQAEEISVNDWETLMTRATGRGAVMPYTRMIGDCNPGPPTHWIKAREAEGKLRLLYSRHEDNPTLFDEAGEITAQGRRSLAILDALSGVRLQRLRFGRWVQAEGAVYEAFNADVHVIDAMPAGWHAWRKILSVDFGYRNPFVCQWWAIDGDGRMYLYRDLYLTGQLVADMARRIMALSVLDFGDLLPQAQAIRRFEARITDHDAEDRATLESVWGVPTVPAYKDVLRGIGNVQDRKRVQPDDRPRLFYLRSAPVERDPELQAAHLPTSTMQENEVYIYATSPDGKPIKEEPVKLYDHGMDAERYAAAWVDRLGEGPNEFFSF
jgi:hypothetical protein